LRREERRDRREQEIRNEAELREAKLLMALKEAQPAVPQTIHLDNTKLPTMSKGEDVELFIEVFETALTVGGVPEDKWTAKLHAALDTETKLSVKETITITDSTYEDIKQALIRQGHLTFTAASEALMTLDEGKLTKLSMRQSIQRLARLLEKATAEATSIRETCLYGDVAIARYFLQPDIKQYVDVKGYFDNDGFCRAIEEWKKTHSGTQVLNYRQRTPIDKQQARFNLGRKQGSCCHCGKGGHFVYECRSRLAGDRPAVQRPEVPPPTQQLTRKRDQTESNRPERDIADLMCFFGAERRDTYHHSARLERQGSRRSQYLRNRCWH